jgi:hypothetical protein
MNKCTEQEIKQRVAQLRARLADETQSMLASADSEHARRKLRVQDQQRAEVFHDIMDVIFNITARCQEPEDAAYALTDALCQNNIPHCTITYK